jgi:hypothetical protein
MIELDEFDGYDYEELLRKWGLEEEKDRLCSAIYDLNELGVLSDWSERQDAAVIQLMIRYINEQCDWDVDGNCHLEENTRQDMLDFLDKLADGEYTNDGAAWMFRAIIHVSFNDYDDHEFVQWFCHCLPYMWN